MPKSYDEIDVEAAAGRIASGKNPDGSDFFVVAGAVNGDGDQVPLRLDATGALYITDGSGGMTVDGTVTATQGGSWTIVATDGDASLTVDDGGLSVSVDDNGASISVDDNGASLTVDGIVDARQYGSWLATVSDGGGTLSVDDNDTTLSVDDGGGSLTVDGAVTVSGTATVSGTVAVSSITTDVVPGTSAASLGKAEDAAYVSGDTGVMMLGVRNDTGNVTFTSANGDYSPIAVTSNGILITTLTTNTQMADGSAVAPAAMYNANGVAQNQMASVGYLFNGTTYDRPRGNMDVQVLASGSRAVNTNTSDLVNYNASGVIVSLSCSSGSGTGGLTLRIQGKDGAGNYYTLLTAPAAITAQSATQYVVYPGASGSSVASVVGLPLPRTWRVTITVGDASSYSYSIQAAYIL